ncbi:hypothetical protein EAH87_14200 [Sphingomonas koreensis]|nr:hypothetical protein EAH87_14200 [Sphingomonas koreensis]
MRPKLPTIRSSLLRLHRAILKSDDERWAIDSTPRLTTLEKMVILLEDRRFLDHRGMDWRSIARELWRVIRFKQHGGASTIDMQLFRTASDRYERTIRRKIRELVGVAVLQRKFTKPEILRIYLKIAYFGTGLNGTVAATQSMFPDNIDESARASEDGNLTADQAARLAALLGREPINGIPKAALI